MKNVLIAIISILPLATVAERVCFKFPSPVCSLCGKVELCAEVGKPEEYFELCPYEDCVDECTGGSMIAPCNPKDGCEPGLGCSVGCAIACIGE